MIKGINLILVMAGMWVGCFGQGENNIWYFGYECGLDFNPGVPVALTNGQTHQSGGVASISDSAGNLLFYTSGDMVWSRNHQIMPNGNGLGGSYTSTQSATIVPFPGSNNLYYIFTCHDVVSALPFCYSIIDMNLNGGFGDVASKCIVLHAQSSDKCAVVYKTGTSDAWVIGHNLDSIFYAYLVTSSGISAPVLSYNSGCVGGYSVGYMKASPKGNKLASALYWDFSFRIYDFDCITGIVSNELIIPIGTTYGPYGIEFSPNASLLYAVPWNSGPFIYAPICQYDITLGTASAIASSVDTIGYLNGSVGDLQIGPDQKIYITTDYQDSLSVINYPNNPGIACGLVENAIPLNFKVARLGLPGLIRGSICNITGEELISKNQIDFQIFPNPTTSTIQLTFTTKHNGAVQCEILNTMGEKVFQSEIPNLKSTINLDVSFLAKGIYVVRVGDACLPDRQGVSWVNKKLVIE